MENFFEKRLFFVVLKLRPTEAHFGTNKKRSLKKIWNEWLEIASRKIRKNANLTINLIYIVNFAKYKDDFSPKEGIDI